MSKQTKKTTQFSNSLHGRPELTFKTLWKQRNFAVPLIIILFITALLYAHGLNNGFLGWDDPWHVTNNKDIQSLSIQNIEKIFTSFYGNMYHPFVTLTFAVEYQFFGLNPVTYHTTNVIFHLANIVLVFFFMLRLSNRREIAIIAACLFGIHPMHVESVAWITERKDVVYAFFYLYALICYIRFIQKEGKKYYWLTIGFFVLSLLSKTTAITLPIILVFIDVYVRRKMQARAIIEKIPLFMLSIVFGIIAMYSQGENAGTVTLPGINFIDRFFLAFYSISYYLVHLFVPINLSALHLMPEKTNGFLPLEYYLSIVPLVVLIVLSLRKGVLQRELVFGTAFFITILSLNIHIIPVGQAIVSERYTYLPYIGLYYSIGWLYCFTIDHDQSLLLVRKKVILIAASLFVVLLGYLTYQRIAVWENTQNLFLDASKKAHTTKQSQYIQAMGYELEGEEKTRAEKFSEAVEWYTKAIALDPQSAKSHSNRGIAKHCLLDYEGAMKDYTKAIELDPTFARAYPNRAAIYILWNKEQEACEDLWKAYNLGLHNVFEIMQVDCRQRE